MIDNLTLTQLTNKRRINTSEFWLIMLKMFKHKKDLLVALLSKIDNDWSGVRFKLGNKTRTPAFSKFRNDIWDLAMLNKGKPSEIKGLFAILEGKDLYIGSMPKSLRLRVENYKGDTQ